MAGLPRGWLHLARLLTLAVLVLASMSASARAAPPPAPTRVPLASLGVRDADAGLPGRWERELARRQAVLRKHRGRDPAAALALLGVLAEVGGEIPDTRLGSWLDSVAGARKRHPLVRSYAGYLRARIDELAGRPKLARARLEREGYLLGWQVIGPFDNAGRKGHEAVYAPETEPFSATQQFHGKLPKEALGWRVHDYGAAPRGGYVSFDDLLRPNTHVVGYATAWIRTAKRREAAIHLGTGGAYKVWLGGKLVGEGETYRSPHPLQEVHGIVLEPGWNRVLIKVAATDGMWGFYARLSAPGGASLADLEVSLEPPETPGAASRSSARSGSSSSLRGLLEQRRARRPTSAAGVALAELYRWIHPFGPEDRTAVDLARAVDRQAKTSRSAWLLAVLDTDQNTSRTALERGIERARSERHGAKRLLAPMMLELAWRYASLGLERRAEKLIDDAHSVARDDAVVELALVDRMESRGFPLVALQWSKHLLARYPDSALLHRDHAGRLLALGRTRDALGVLERLAGRHGGDRGLVAQRIDALLRLGQADRAASLARAASAATPGFPSAHAEVARLEEARGQRDAARAALAKAIALAPQDAELHAELGRLASRTGNRKAAIASLRRSLELKPQQPEIRDLLGVLDRSSEKDLFDRYAVALEKVAKQPVPKSWQGQAAGVLRSMVAVRLLPNGLSERLDHRIIRILDDRGIRGQAVQAMAYDPAESTVEVRRARVHRHNGAVEDLGERYVVPLAEAGYRMYYDQRQIEVHFSGLRVGDTLEVAFVRRDVASRNMFDEYFGDIVALQGTEPRKRTTYVLEAPADKPLYFSVEPQKRLSKDGKTATYRYSARNVPGIKQEANMPGWTEIARYLHVSTYRTWDDVGRWYWDLVRKQLVVSSAIRGGVKEVLAKLPANADERDKVDAIYEHVVRSTRYVGLEFGIHGYKPYRTSDVYARRFGDCKDKASLLKVMLAEVGVDAHLVLVRTRERGTVAPKPASLAAFNHAIVYVPKYDLYMDGTAEWSGPRELPSSDQGATVLIVRDGKGADLRTTPFSKPADNLRAIAQKVALDRKGGARVEHRLAVGGSDAQSMRYQFHSPEQRVERLSKLWGRRFPGTEVVSIEAPDISNVLMPAEIRAKLRVPTWATVERDQLRFRVLGRHSSLVRRLAPQAKRRHDLVLDVPAIQRHDVVYELPRGMRFSQVPSSQRIESPFGRFELAVESSGGRASVRTTFEIRRHRVPVPDYPAFRDFLRRVDGSLEQRFEVEVDR